MAGGSATVPRVVAERIGDAALATAFRAGDESALRAAYDTWGGMVLRFAERLLPTVSDAEDVTQQVFVSAWNSRERYDPDKAPLPAWLIGIARHKVLDRRRATDRLPTPVATLQEHSSDPTDIDLVADRLLVAEALARLPEEQRHALELAFFEGRSHQEVAARLGLPLGTAKSHIRRGLERLRRSLPEGGGP